MKNCLARVSGRPGFRRLSFAAGARVRPAWHFEIGRQIMSLRKFVLALAVVATAAPLTPLASAPAFAQGGGRCYDLWYQRNAIYANRGYCFKTAQARSVFGPGCFPPYGRLSPAEKRQVAWIQAQENRFGCRW
jgi:hypothetical protein